MKKLLAMVVWLTALVCALVTSSVVDAAPAIEKAPDNCSHAMAIFGWSDFKKGKDEKDEEFEARVKRPWKKMGWVVGRLNWGRKPGHEAVVMADEYEPGSYNSVAFKEYHVGDNDNAKAYVAHCGYGGTCNQLAQRLFRIYKGIGVPKVYCTREVPKMLHDSVRPDIPLPTDEELAETDDDGGGDDDDDDDDEF